MLPQIWDKLAKILAGIGALNWGLVKFVNFDVLSLLGAGTIKTVGLIAVAVSGGYLLYLAIKKKI